MSTPRTDLAASRIADAAALYKCGVLDASDFAAVSGEWFDKIRSVEIELADITDTRDLNTKRLEQELAAVRAAHPDTVRLDALLRCDGTLWITDGTLFAYTTRAEVDALLEDFAARASVATKEAPALSADTEIQLDDGRWVLAVTYPQFDAAKNYPTRIRAPLPDLYINGGKIGVGRTEITDK